MQKGASENEMSSEDPADGDLFEVPFTEIGPPSQGDGHATFKWTLCDSNCKLKFAIWVTRNLLREPQNF